MAFAVKAKSLVVPILEVRHSEGACEQQMLFRAPDELHGDVAQIAALNVKNNKCKVQVWYLKFKLRDKRYEE
jgi:hypothetical protein